MKKIICIAILLLFTSMTAAYPEQDKVIEKAQEYIGHNEALVSVKPFSFEGNIYWVAEYGQRNEGKGYIVIEGEEKEAAKDQEILSAVAAAKIFKEQGKDQKVYQTPGKYLNLSQEHENTSRRMENLSQSLTEMENSGGIQSELHKLAEKNKETAQYFFLMSIHLNQSTQRFSPKDASKYLEYVEKTQGKIEEIQKENSDLVDSVKYWGHQNNHEEKAGEIEGVLTKKQKRNKEILKSLRPQMEEVEKRIADDVERTLGRVRSEEREMLTLPVILLTLGLAAGATFLLHLWGKRR